MADVAPSAFDGFLSYSHAADDLLAPRLQTGLQRFAKPWWRRRALRMFRDEASLSANPHLWSSITDALDDSGWFVLLLSPDAARSEWVNREIDYWVEHKDPGRILPVVTDGTFDWADGEVAGDAVPASLRGVFSDEPRWVDLRFARSETQLDLRHTRFRDAVADIAAAVRGVAKDELVSEEIRQHRRTIRTAWTGGIAILALGIAATIGAIIAVDQSNQAQAQRDQAQQERDRAVAAEETASEERDRANLLAEQEAAARADSRVRELVAESTVALDIDPERSVLLALEVVGPASGDESDASIAALRAALAADRVVLRISGDEFVDYGPDGSKIVTGSGSDAAIWDAYTGELIQTLPSSAGRTATRAAFSPGGSIVAIGYTRVGSEGPDGPLAILWDTATGDVVAALDGPELPGPNWVAFSGDGTLLAGSGDEPGVVVWDARSGAELYRIETGYGPSLSPDGSLLAYADDTATDVGRIMVLDARTGQDLFALEAPGFWPNGARFDPDGRRLAALSQNPGGLIIWDVESRREIASLPQDGAPVAVEWSPDGRTIALSGNEGIPRILDPESGDEIVALVGQTSGVWSLSFDPLGQRIAAAASGGETMVWDITGPGPGEVAAFPSPYGDVFPGFTSQGEVIVVEYGNPSGIARLDPITGEMLAMIPDQLFKGPHARPKFWPEAGLVGTVNADGSAALHELDTFDHVVDLPPGTVASAVSPDREWIVLNPLEEGEAVLARIGAWEDGVPIHEKALTYADFGPTGELLSILDGSAPGGSWLVEVPTGSRLASFPYPELASRISPDGSLLAVPTFEGGILRLYDTTALRNGRTPEEATVWTRDAHTGAIPDARFNHDGTLVATSGLVDLHIRIWDTQTGDLVADLGSTGHPFPQPEFHPNGTHVIAQGAGGTIRIFTLATEELVEIAVQRLTRTFTAKECATYRIDPCPAEPKE